MKNICQNDNSDMTKLQLLNFFANLHELIFIRPTMNFIGIIPARFASTRFPGKPLIDIGGKSMIRRVYEQASKALKWVYVATDDEKIAGHVESFDGKVVMTSKDHKSGTDRCSEAIKIISEIEGNINFDVVVNIQGDEPFIKPEQLRLVMSCFEDSAVNIATLAKPIEDSNEIFNPNVVKVIRDKELFAIYFSRSPLPYVRNEIQENWHNNFQFLKHIGIYAYKTTVLKQLTAMAPSSLELAESLEQNRWIENGYSIYVETTKFDTIAIDSPEDLKKIEHLI
jgi:3-deoxy-manno-octulosonate cytidylyltransferase (CMP-KDO synthetase)